MYCGGWRHKSCVQQFDEEEDACDAGQGDALG